MAISYNYCLSQWPYLQLRQKIKMVAIVGGALYGRPMKRLGFRYDRHEGMTRYVQIRHMYYHPMVMRVFCLLSAGSVIPDAIVYILILNTFQKTYVLISLS